MELGKNKYKKYFYLTKESGDKIRDNQNYYLKTNYSKKQLIELFKERLKEDEEIGEKYKKAVLDGTVPIYYRMVYTGYFSAKCDVYNDDYATVEYESVYVGTSFYSTIKDAKWGALAGIFGAKEGVVLERAEENIDIIADHNVAQNLYNDMVERERERWVDVGSESIVHFRNPEIVTLHIPALIIGVEFENEKYFSIVHAVTGQSYIAGHYSEERVREILIKEAKSGNHVAQFDLAYRLANEKNYKEAFYWYSQAKDKNIYALNNLGVLYENGRGTDKDVKKAFECYKKSAEKDNDVACGNLARCYEKGIGCNKNLEQAIVWYKKAIEKGNKKAKEALDRISSSEETKDEAEIINTYHDIENKYPHAFNRLSRPKTYFNKEIVLSSWSRLDSLQLEELSDKGHGKASFYIGNLCDYFEGVGSKKSIEYYKKAQREGYDLANLQLARYEYLWTKENYQKIIDNYKIFIQNYVGDKNYKGLAYYEMYTLTKKFFKKCKQTYEYLYLAYKNDYHCYIELIESKHKYAYYYTAKAKESSYSSEKDYLKPAKAGVIEAQFELALIYYKMGKNKKAKKWFNKVLKNKQSRLPEYKELKEKAQSYLGVI